MLLLRPYSTTRCLFKTFRSKPQMDNLLLIYAHSHLLFYFEWKTGKLSLSNWFWSDRSYTADSWYVHHIRTSVNCVHLEMRLLLIVGNASAFVLSWMEWNLLHECMMHMSSKLDTECDIIHTYFEFLPCATVCSARCAHQHNYISFGTWIGLKIHFQTVHVNFTVIISFDVN